MVDYQFLGLVAVVLAVVTRGSVLPVLAVLAVIVVVMVAYEAGARRFRCRHPHPAGPPPLDSAAPTDSELALWMAVMDRVLRTKD